MISSLRRPDNLPASGELVRFLSEYSCSIRHIGGERNASGDILCLSINVPAVSKRTLTLHALSIPKIHYSRRTS